MIGAMHGRVVARSVTLLLLAALAAALMAPVASVVKAGFIAEGRGLTLGWSRWVLEDELYPRRSPRSPREASATPCPGRRARALRICWMILSS
jgi:hypothetical protein